MFTRNLFLGAIGLALFCFLIPAAWAGVDPTNALGYVDPLGIIPQNQYVVGTEDSFVGEFNLLSPDKRILEKEFKCPDVSNTWVIDRRWATLGRILIRGSLPTANVMSKKQQFSSAQVGYQWDDDPVMLPRPLREGKPTHIESRLPNQVRVSTFPDAPAPFNTITLKGFGETRVGNDGPLTKVTHPSSKTGIEIKFIYKDCPYTKPDDEVAWVLEETRKARIDLGSAADDAGADDTGPQTIGNLEITFGEHFNIKLLKAGSFKYSVEYVFRSIPGVASSPLVWKVWKAGKFAGKAGDAFPVDASKPFLITVSEIPGRTGDEPASLLLNQDGPTDRDPV